MNTRNIQIQRYNSPCGNLILGSFDNKLCLCDWEDGKHHRMILDRLERYLHVGCEIHSSSVIQEAVRQLDEYFSKERFVFDMPLLIVGTEFQKHVWQCLLTIPYGETLSYAALAGELGMRKAVRAVANANGANAISIFVPCHRVIGSNRSLIGYGGGIEIKKFLLGLETMDLFS